MPKKRHTPEEIVSKLRQVDVLVAQGTPVADAIRAIGVTEVTYYVEVLVVHTDTALHVIDEVHGPPRTDACIGIGRDVRGVEGAEGCLERRSAGEPERP